MARPVPLIAAVLLLSACGGGDPFSDRGNGVLKDSRSGLEWRQSDNGSDIGFEDARAYCAGLGGGWRLPSVEELTALYDNKAKHAVPCGTFDGNPLTCNVSPRFHLTGPTPWSNVTARPPGETIVGLSPLRKGPGPIDGTDGARALCVHSP
jgi:hypothetical protein